jgi:hypothetical protein
VYAPRHRRLLKLRERRRYGDAIAPGGLLEQNHRDFLAYAEGYDTGVFTGAMAGRHRARHDAWLAALPCPVHRLDGARSTEALVDVVLSARLT